ncbi:hypothetical protein P4O66_009057, partial [Electrophorus voltai]
VPSLYANTHSLDPDVEKADLRRRTDERQSRSHFRGPGRLRFSALPHSAMRSKPHCRGSAPPFTRSEAQTSRSPSDIFVPSHLRSMVNDWVLIAEDSLVSFWSLHGLSFTTATPGLEKSPNRLHPCPPCAITLWPAVRCYHAQHSLEQEAATDILPPALCLRRTATVLHDEDRHFTENSSHAAWNR